MSISLYELAVMLIGEVPPQFSFVYIILTLCLMIMLIICVFAPFILVYKWFSK